METIYCTVQVYMISIKYISIRPAVLVCTDLVSKCGEADLALLSLTRLLSTGLAVTSLLLS